MADSVRTVAPDGDGGTRRGRPRRQGVADAVLAATVTLVADHGYAGTSLDAIARQAGVAKTTVYRRWESKRTLVVDALAAAMGEPPLTGAGDRSGLATTIGWLAARIAEPEVRLLLTGLSAEAARDPELRRRLRAGMREPFTAAVAARWDLPPDRVELAFDVVVGTALHRVALTGELTRDDVEAITDLATSLLFGPTA